MGLRGKTNRLEETVSRYLGRIEGQERIDLSREKAELIALGRRLGESLLLIDEVDLDEEEMERFSRESEQQLYSPIADILRGILGRIDSSVSTEHSPAV